jgi:uncharacterized membrane protein
MLPVDQACARDAQRFDRCAIARRLRRRRGNLAVIANGDTAAVTLSAIPAGTFLPIACSKIMSTNTTATLIVAIYV